MTRQKGWKHTEETKQKMRLSKLGEKNPNWKGNDITPDTGRQRARNLYKTTDNYEIHHKNGNTLNNSKENILIVTRKEHMIIDGRLELLIQNGKKVIRKPKEHTTTICQNCKKIFPIRPWRLRKWKNHFCSRRCKHAFLSKIIVCLNCGKTKVVDRSSHAKYFCSLKCWYEYRKKRKVVLKKDNNMEKGYK